MSGRPDPKRGRHKRRGSPETARWAEFLREQDWLQPEARVEQSKPAPAAKPKPLPPAPAQPVWLDPAEYEALLALRRRL